jgi:hypothetical protein
MPSDGATDIEVSELTVQLGDLSVTVSRTSGGSSQLPIDAESWKTREERARQVGESARAKLAGGAPSQPELPRTHKANTLWIVLRDNAGFDLEPIGVHNRWSEAQPFVDGDSKGSLAPLAVHAAFASKREAQIYVHAASRQWPNQRIPIPAEKVAEAATAEALEMRES